MPLQDANDPVLDTSDDTILDADLDIRGEGPVVGDNGAESSDAHDEGAGERSTLDVVQDVVKARDPNAEGSSPDGQKDGQDPDRKADQAAKERDDENYTDVPFHKHPRFQQLLKQRDSFKEDASRYRNVQGFLDQNGVTGEEASQVLTILAQSKSNPAQAWAALKPMVQQLLIDAGEVLPAELKARVDSGELTVEAANEIARANARSASAQRAQETAAQRQERLQQEAHIQSLRGAANAWEADRQAKDPNFEAKKSLVMKELAWIHTTEGKATDPAKVKDQLDRAYKAANENWRPVARRQPAAPPVGQATRQRPAASSASQSQQPRKDEPAGALKFIKRVVENRGAAA